jgi:SNF family Na+-dependent transporter
MPTTAIMSNTNKNLLISAGAAVAIATAITVYYLLISAWIIVIRSGEDENALPSIENRFKIADDDLAELPSSREAMARANGNYPL